MGSGERDKANRSIEDWLAQKLAAGLDEDDTDPEPAPELPPLPEELGGPHDEAEQTMHATLDATLAADLEHTRESVVEPSVPIPWPDWEPEPFPSFDVDPPVREPSLPIPDAAPPWEGDTDPENTVDLLADETRTPALEAPGSLPPWDDDTDPESTSTLLRESPAPAPTREAAPPPPPPRPKVAPPSPVKQLAAARAPRRRDATPVSAPGRAVAQRPRGPVADPRPSARPLQRRDPGAPVPTTWEEDRLDDDPELSYPGIDAPADPGEPVIEDLEAAPLGSFDEVFPPPRPRGGLEDWGPTAIGRTAGGTPRDPPTIREDPDGGTVTAPRPARGVSEEATDIRGFSAPSQGDPSLFEEQPTVIVKPKLEPPPPPPQPPGPEDDYMTTLLAWTGASVGIIAFIVIVGISVLIAQYLGLLDL